MGAACSAGQCHCLTGSQRSGITSFDEYQPEHKQEAEEEPLERSLPSSPARAAEQPVGDPEDAAARKVTDVAPGVSKSTVDSSPQDAGCSPAGEYVYISGEVDQTSPGSAGLDAKLASDDSSPPANGDGELVLPALPIEEQLALALEEDRAVLEFDYQRQEAALAVLPQLRQRVGAVAADVDAVVLEDARRFYSDETLVRYLCCNDSNVDKAATMLQATAKWRGPFFRGADLSPLRTDDGRPPVRTLCPCCAVIPTSHCFFRVGIDSIGRDVIYSCAGRALNKNCEEGMLHMSLEFERLYQGNSISGRAVWVIDFAGFGLGDCNPRVGLTAVPLFANHYCERFSQIVLFGMPALVTGMYQVVMRLVDQVTRRRVVILRSEAAQQRYMKTYWSTDPAMLEWLKAVLRCRGAPGCYPSLDLSRKLNDASAVELLERCVAQGKGK